MFTLVFVHMLSILNDVFPEHIYLPVTQVDPYNPSCQFSVKFLSISLDILKDKVKKRVFVLNVIECLDSFRWGTFL